jgi:hypothetical protein
MLPGRFPSSLARATPWARAWPWRRACLARLVSAGSGIQSWSRWRGLGGFLLALGALVAILLVEGRGDGVAHGEVAVQLRRGGGGQGAEGLRGAGLVEVGEGGGQGLAVGLAVVFFLGTQADEEHPLGGQGGHLMQQQGPAGLAVQVPLAEDAAQMALAGGVDELGGRRQLALLEDAENETGAGTPRQVAALDAEFHGKSLLVEGLGWRGYGGAPPVPPGVKMPIRASY